MDKKITIGIITQLVFLVFLVFLLNFFIFSIKNNQLSNILIFCSFVLVGILLIKNILLELRIQEQLEFLIKKLNNANDQLKLLDKQKSEFISIASHQLRSPLTVVQGYTSMILEEDFGKVPARLKEPLNKINTSSKSIGSLINDFLSISRIEKGQLEYHLDSFNVVELLNNLFQEFSLVVKDHNLILRTNYNHDDKIFIKADYEKLKQIISNLIDNSIKYTIKGYIEMSLQKKSGKVLIGIKDTGIGIAPQNVSRVFQKFTRLENAKLVNVYGNGLGLYVAKVMTEAQDAKIWVESDGENKGSTFFVEFKML